MATRDGDGATPLHFAASKGHLSVVKWLVFHGARADDKDNFGKTPIDDAAENRHADVVDLLSASAGATSASSRRSVCALTDDEGRSRVLKKFCNSLTVTDTVVNVSKYCKFIGLLVSKQR